MKIIFMMLVIVFSLVSIGETTWVISTYESKIQLENQILNDAEQRNLMVINSVDNYISERVIDMLSISNNNQIIQAVISSNAEFQNMTNPTQYIEQQNASWASASPDTITPIMNQIIQNPTADKLRQTMNVEKAIYHTNVFGRFLVANSFGADVASNIKPDGYDQSSNSWFVQAKQNGFYIGNIGLDKASGLIAIPISTRLNDNNGNFIGVAKGEITINNVNNIISRQVESGGLHPIEYELINDNGTVLYSSTEMEKPFNYTYPPDFMQNIQNQSGRFTYQFSDDSNPHFITYAHSNSSEITPTSDWILITEYDPAQILAPVKQLSDFMIFILAIIAFGTVICGIFVANKIAKPIRDVALATNNFSKGNASSLEPHGANEVKELASNFNQMMESITNSQKQIQEYGAKYRNLFELSPNPISVLDRNFRVILMNDELVGISGYSREELAGKPVSELLAERSLEEFVRIYNSAQAGNEINLKEQLFWSKRKDGTVFPTLVNAKTIYSVDGSVTGYLVVSKDHTDTMEKQKKIEEEEEEMRKQIEYLHMIDKQKNSFLSMMSHELTTLLFPIKFHIEMLKDPSIFGQLNKEQVNSVNDIHQNAVRLERLIADYLDVQKLEIGHMEFTRTNFKLDQFMNKIMEENYPLMASKSIEFINSTEDKITLSSDADRLRQVFANLITNSIDFVSEKTGKIEIGARVQEKDVLFYVRDNGSGIPEDKQSSLFKKFYQVDTSVTRKHNGGGLGLNMCKGIVEGLGGKIGLDSTAGLGTTVYFTIPRGDSK